MAISHGSPKRIKFFFLSNKEALRKVARIEFEEDVLSQGKAKEFMKLTDIMKERGAHNCYCSVVNVNGFRELLSSLEIWGRINLFHLEIGGDEDVEMLRNLKGELGVD